MTEAQSAERSPQLLLATVAGFAGVMARGYDVSDMLHELVSTVASVLPISGAGVSLVEGDHLKFVTADSEQRAELETVQDEHQLGPCVEAWRTGAPVLIGQLAERAEDWPAYVARAGELGIASVAAIPLSLDKVIGTLDLYGSAPRTWAADEVAVACVLADIAAAFVRNASALMQERRVNEQLRQALDSRVLIEQAKGIIANERGVSVDEAFRVLRKYANDRNLTLRAIAGAVVNLGLRP